MKKAAIFLLIILLIQLIPLAVSADSAGALNLTLEDCMNRAVENTHQTAVMDQQIKSLWKQEDSAMQASNSIQTQLDMMARYKTLYDNWTHGATLYPEDQYNLMVYKAMFGERPPVYNSYEMFDKFIKNRDFPHYSLWAASQNLETSKLALAASVKMGVKQVYDSIFDLQDSLTMQQDLYNTMKKQNEQMLVKYKNGKVSEVDKYLSDVSLEKQQLTNGKLVRSLENLKMTLRQQIGIPLTQEITLATYDNSKGIKPGTPYPTYLNNALKNRSEIITAKMDLQVKQREDDIMKQYVTNEMVDERMDADQALEDKTMALDDAINQVTSDISAGYKDVQLKKSDYTIAVSKLQNSEKQYKNAQLMYDKGLTSLADFWNAEISLTQAKLGYNKAMRDYNNAVYKLETAAGIGPGYTSGMGGN